VIAVPCVKVIFYKRVSKYLSRGEISVRTIWRGAISFGLVHIPIKLYTATQEKSLKFNYLHKQCNTPIKYAKVCPVCGGEVKQDEIVSGYQYEPGRYVILTEDDFAKIPLATAKTIEILDFVNLNEIDPVFFSKSYYLAPSEGGQKPYALLRQAMVETEKIAIAKVILRKKEALACLRVQQGQALIMETMFYPDEVKEISTVPDLQFTPTIHEHELKMAVTLIQNLSTHFQPEKYTDNYREALLQLVSSKIEGEAVTIPQPEGQAEVIDLLKALEESIKATEEQKELVIR